MQNRSNPASADLIQRGRDGLVLAGALVAADLRRVADLVDSLDAEGILIVPTKQQAAATLTALNALVVDILCPCCEHAGQLDHRTLEGVSLREVWCRCAVGEGVPDCDCQVTPRLLDTDTDDEGES